MNTVCLFIDDERHPGIGLLEYDEVHVARSSKEAADWVYINGCPDHIAFDHDLGGDDTTIRFIWWLIQYDMDNPGFIKDGFTYSVHSANPVGAENIKELLNSYLGAKTK